MRVSVYTIEKTLFEGDAEKIIARTSTGEITVLDDHIPLVSKLMGPAIRIIDKNQKEHIINCGSGFIEVRPKKEVVILGDT